MKGLKKLGKNISKQLPSPGERGWGEVIETKISGF